MKDLKHFYNEVGEVLEDQYGIWEAINCDCSGYIDEDYSLVITHKCPKHQDIDRVPWVPQSLS